MEISPPRGVFPSDPFEKSRLGSPEELHEAAGRDAVVLKQGQEFQPWGAGS